MKSKIIGILYAIVFSCAWTAVLAGVATEDKVKTAYIYHIINFITWPDKSFTASKRPVTICLLGDVQIRHSIYSLQNREINKHLIEIKQISYIKDNSTCRILFIGNNSTQKIDKILQSIQSRGILTLGDFPNFVEAGGMIGFIKRGNNIRLEINLNAANKAGISISAKLAEVAVKIIGGPGG